MVEVKNDIGTGVEGIVEPIVEKFKREIEGLFEELKEFLLKELDKEYKDALRRIDIEFRRAKHDVELEIRKAVSIKELEYKRELQNTKARLIEELLEEAKRELPDLIGEKYAFLIENLLRNSISLIADKKVIVVAAPEDKKLIEGIVEKLRGSLEKEIQLSEDVLDGDRRGFILYSSDRKTVIRMTLDDLFHSLRGELRMVASKILFE